MAKSPFADNIIALCCHSEERRFLLAFRNARSVLSPTEFPARDDICFEPNDTAWQRGILYVILLSNINNCQVPIYRSVFNKRTEQNSPFKGSRAKPGGVAFFVKTVCYLAEATPLSASLTFPLERGIFGFGTRNSPVNRNLVKAFRLQA